VPFLETIQVALVAGLLGLDRLAFGQFMFSQPIVAAPLIGALLGDVHTGLMIGVVLELYWLRCMPVGGHVPKDATLSAVLTTGLTLLPVQSAEAVDPAWIAWVFLWVGVLLVPVGRLEQWLRRKNAWLIRGALSSASLDRGIARSVGMGILVFFIYYFGITCAAFGLSWPFLIRGYSVLSYEVLQGLGLFFYLLPAMGMASLLSYKDLTSGRIHLGVGGAASLLLFVVFMMQSGWPLVFLFLLALTMVFVQKRRSAASS